MATLIDNKFDLFQADARDADINGGLQYEDGTIAVPHFIGQMIVGIGVSIRQGNSPFGKVPMIKFMREWYRQTHGKNLGLKDAKDIVDHYQGLACMSPLERPTHLR